VLEQAAHWRAEGRGVALATVVRTWGSSPRPAGSQLAVSDDGAFVGSVSGGCIEGAVIHEARAAMDDGQPRLLEFGVTSEMAWEVGLACGGQVQVFIDRVNAGLLDELRAARRAKRPMVLITRLPDGAQRLLELRGTPPEGVSPALLDAARLAAARDETSIVEEDGATIFLQPFNPPLRLILVGAVHIAQPLARMAALAGFATVVVDPRSAFATDDRFPGVERSTKWPDEALTALAPDGRTAVVTLTHDPKLDDPALDVALRSRAFYIGCLGSGKTHAARRERLARRGFTAADLARLHGPVGLRINARSPAEIAISILAEIIQELRPDKR